MPFRLLRNIPFTCSAMSFKLPYLRATPLHLPCYASPPVPPHCSPCLVMSLHLPRHTLPRLTPSPYTSAVLSIYIPWPAFISALCGTLSKVAGRGRGGRQRVNHTAGTPRLCTETDQQGTWEIQQQGWCSSSRGFQFSQSWVRRDNIYLGVDAKRLILYCTPES